MNILTARALRKWIALEAANLYHGRAHYKEAIVPLDEVLNSLDRGSDNEEIILVLCAKAAVLADYGSIIEAQEISDYLEELVKGSCVNALTIARVLLTRGQVAFASKGEYEPHDPRGEPSRHSSHSRAHMVSISPYLAHSADDDDEAGDEDESIGDQPGGYPRHDEQSEAGEEDKSHSDGDGRVEDVAPDEGEDRVAGRGETRSFSPFRPD